MINLASYSKRIETFPDKVGIPRKILISTGLYLLTKGADWRRLDISYQHKNKGTANLKGTTLHVRWTKKTQISMRIHAVRSEP